MCYNVTDSAFNEIVIFRVLLRVRMLYYIKHEIIGDLVQHIADGVNARYVGVLAIYLIDLS